MSPPVPLGPGDEAITAGRILAVLRGLRGLTEQELAERSGLNKSAISDYETGRRAIPEPRRQRILTALGLPLRAWDDTVQHVEWLAWLAGDGPERSMEAKRPRPSGTMASHDPAAALRVLRALRRLTQKQLARRSGINKATISSYEPGQQPIGPANLSALLEALEVTPRAWEATVRHVAWVDHLTSADRDAFEAEALRLAESMARDFETSVFGLLRLVLALSGRVQDDQPVDDRTDR